MRYLLALVSAATIVGLACDPQFLPPPRDEQNPPPTPSSEITDSCLRACENLRSADVNCPEGFGAVGGEPCAVTCVVASRLRPLPLSCWTNAKTAVDARACGALRCVR